MILPFSKPHIMTMQEIYQHIGRASMSNYPDGMTQADHDREFDGPAPTDLEIREKASDVLFSMSNDDIIDLIGNASDEWRDDFCEAIRDRFWLTAAAKLESLVEREAISQAEDKLRVGE